MLELKGSPSWIRTTLHGLTVRRLHLDCSWGMFLLIITLATPKGFEPLTFGFGDQRSAGLNYGAIYINNPSCNLHQVFTHSLECVYQNTLHG